MSGDLEKEMSMSRLIPHSSKRLCFKKLIFKSARRYELSRTLELLGLSPDPLNYNDPGKPESLAICAYDRRPGRFWAGEFGMDYLKKSVKD